MPAVIRLGDFSTGHLCFFPTPLVSTPVNKTFINGKKPGVVSNLCQHLPHTCGIVIHVTRDPSDGASKTFIEGYPAARIGDDISCGDACGEGSPNTFIE
jgi:uncharacterized Zn-binding protein involved in type VI secretion